MQVRLCYFEPIQWSLLAEDCILKWTEKSWFAHNLTAKDKRCLSKSGSLVSWTYVCCLLATWKLWQTIGPIPFSYEWCPPPHYHSLWRVEDISHTYELRSQLQHGEPQPLFHGPNNWSRHRGNWVYLNWPKSMSEKMKGWRRKDHSRVYVVG